MKAFIAFVALVAIVTVQGASLSDEQKQKLLGSHKECEASSGVDQGIIDKVRKGEFPKENDKLKDHLFCVAKKVGFMDEAGELQKDVIKTKLSTFLDGAVVDKIIAECAIKKDTPPQTAYDNVKCFHEKTPDHVVFL